VSPWTWNDPKNKLEDWLAERKRRSSWKDVRYIDGSALETWLEQRPAVAAWHARHTLGVMPQECVRSIDEFWQHFVGQFNPTLTEEVLLCERDDVAQQLIQDLLQPSNIVSLVADSPDEVVAFAIAAIRKAAKDVHHFLEVRTLVVDSAAAAASCSPTTAWSSCCARTPQARRRNSLLLARSLCPTVVRRSLKERQFWQGRVASV
jgi:hypothetical protein